MDNVIVIYPADLATDIAVVGSGCLLIRVDMDGVADRIEDCAITSSAKPAGVTKIMEDRNKKIHKGDCVVVPFRVAAGSRGSVQYDARNTTYAMMHDVLCPANVLSAIMVAARRSGLLLRDLSDNTVFGCDETETYKQLAYDALGIPMARGLIDESATALEAQ